MYKISLIDKISFIFVIIGALAWLGYGLTGVNIVNLLLGNLLPFLERAVYIIVGLSGIDMLYFLFKTSYISSK